MKNVRLAALIIGLLFLAAVVGLFGYRIANRYLIRSEANQPSCQSTYATHNVIIINDIAVPQQTVASKCDKLTITNRDHQLRDIAFGPHPEHIPYDGVSERILNFDQSLTITLVQTGNFTFHDHIDPGVGGHFTVNN